MKLVHEPKRPQLETVYEGLFGPKIDKIISWAVPFSFGIITFLLLFLR